MRQGTPLGALARRRPLVTGLAGALLIVAVLCAFDRYWLWPLVRHVVTSHSGRSIDFRAMHLGLDAQLDPRVAFDGLVVENAAWAHSREPWIEGEKVILELTWEGLRTGIWTIKRLVLEDAKVDFERLADGRRNSRLSTPDGRGPPRATLRSIDARRTRLRVLDEPGALDLRIESTPLASPLALAGHPELTLTRRLSFDGAKRGTPFRGQADVSDTVTLQHTGDWTGVQGDIRTAGAHLGVAGRASDLLRSSRLDVDLHLGADRNDDRPAGRFAWLSALRDATADTHLVREGAQWTASKLQVKAPGGDLAGVLEYRQAASAGERGRLAATLDARRLDADELHRLALAIVRRADTAAVVSPRPAPAQALAGTEAADASAAVPALDADIDLRIARLVSARGWSAQDTRLHANLARAQWRVALAETRIAGGHGTGELAFDTAASPAEARLELHLTGVRLDELPLAKLHRQLPAGRIRGSALLSARGHSMNDLVGSASGTLRASLEGATVSRRLEAEVGLDGFGLLRSLVDGADQVPVSCAEVSLELRNGRGTIRHLAFDTPRTSITGRGGVDLATRTLDVVLAPASNVDALLVLPKDIRIRGPIDGPTLSLQARGKPTGPLRCGSG